MIKYSILTFLFIFLLIENINYIEASENPASEDYNLMVQNKDYEEIIKLAKNGDKSAQNYLIKIYSEGIGKESILNEAIGWFENAINFSSNKNIDNTEISTIFLRSTIICKIKDLEPSITFWRDVMGYEFSGMPSSFTSGSSSLMGWTKDSKRSFTSFKSQGGSTIALLIIEDSDFSEIKLTSKGTAFNDIILVHEANNIKKIFDRAIKHKVDIIKPYGPSSTGKSIQLFLRAPTGHFVEIYEILS